MGFEFDFDKIPQIETAVEQAENFNSKVPNVCDTLEEIAKQVNAPVFTMQVDAIKSALDTWVTLMKDFIGDAGDNSADGTLKGFISIQKKAQAAMSGE